MTKSLFVALAFVAALLAACAGAPLRESAPESVLRAREAALIERDVEKILAMFADDAVVTTSSGRRLIGKDQIRVWVKDQSDRSQREEAGPRQRDGNKLSWAGKVYREDWQKLGASPLDVIQDAVIEGGKIKMFSTRFTPESASKLEAARRKK